MRLTTYESAVILKSGPQGCSVMAAPPPTSRRSNTVTRAPCLARRPAATRPLWPPPITTTSNGSCELPGRTTGSGYGAARSGAQCRDDARAPAACEREVELDAVRQVHPDDREARGDRQHGVLHARCPLLIEPHRGGGE